MTVDNIRNRNILRIFVSIVIITLHLVGCARLQLKKTEHLYTWSSFFNKNCGPVIEIIDNGKGEATLVFDCSSGKKITQHAILQGIEGTVELWVSHRLSAEKLYELSNAKCQASLLHIGPNKATINFPCALVHMTVGYDITNRVAQGSFTRIRLKPTKTMITYGDGVQEFSVEKGHLIPSAPFEPFPRDKTKGKRIPL